MLVFEERGKPEYPEKNLSEQSREPTNSAHIWRRVQESNPGHIGGRRALSPLRQPCEISGIFGIIGKTPPVNRATSFLGSPLYILGVERGPWAQGRERS